MGPWLPPSVSRFQDSPTPWPGSRPQCFLWPHTVPGHGEVAFCLLVCRSTDTGVVSTFWSLWTVLLRTCVFVHLCMFGVQRSVRRLDRAAPRSASVRTDAHPWGDSTVPSALGCQEPGLPTKGPRCRILPEEGAARPRSPGALPPHALSF